VREAVVEEGLAADFDGGCDVIDCLNLLESVD
jgi:hypothetical protein